MAEKKYYWLKMTDQFFEDKAIKKLRKIAGGDTYTIIYLKMLLTAIKQGNKMYFEGIEDDFMEELALELDEDTDNVKVTVSYLKSKGLIEVLGADEILLTQCAEMVGSETDAARRKRLQRDRERNRAIGSDPVPALEEKSEVVVEEKPAKKKAENTIQLFHRLVEDYNISEPVREKMEVWFRYKMERKESYKEQGMKSLLKKTENNEGKSDKLDDAKKEAKEILEEKGSPKVTSKLIAPDIPCVRKGDIIHAKVGSLNGYYLINSIQHNAKNGQMTMDVKKTADPTAAPKKKTPGTTKKKTYKVGDVVNFKGGTHYDSSWSDARGYRATAGKAKITLGPNCAGNGKAHPWHLVHMDSKSNVYGWVDEGTFE